MARRPADARPAKAGDENAATTAAIRRVAELLARYPGLPFISHINVLLHYRPPRADLWVREARHVAIWAETLGTGADAKTYLNDSPQRSHVTTETPLIELEEVQVRILHLYYLPQDGVYPA